MMENKAMGIKNVEYEPQATQRPSNVNAMVVNSGTGPTVLGQYPIRVSAAVKFLMSIKLTRHQV
jgi:hypothetical protein